jgi:hypothetical protein
MLILTASEARREAAPKSHCSAFKKKEIYFHIN